MRYTNLRLLYFTYFTINGPLYATVVLSVVRLSDALVNYCAERTKDIVRRLPSDGFLTVFLFPRMKYCDEIPVILHLLSAFYAIC